MRRGCENILSTTTIEPSGSIRACCGIASRQISELLIGNIHDIGLADADRVASDDFLKRWIRVDGPESILAWAASHDPAIQWEHMYAHRCQACLRLYGDPRVRQVIMECHKEKLADVIFAEWLLFHYKPNMDNQ
jgi:hypothetical protein